MVSAVEVAELVKRWMGDVGAWCLPGYGVPLALILSAQQGFLAVKDEGELFVSVRLKMEGTVKKKKESNSQVRHSKDKRIRC